MSGVTGRAILRSKGQRSSKKIIFGTSSQKMYQSSQR